MEVVLKVTATVLRGLDSMTRKINVPEGRFARKEQGKEAEAGEELQRKKVN